MGQEILNYLHHVWMFIKPHYEVINFAAASIQVVTEIVGAIGLLVYCKLTYSIRRESTNQSKASHRPFLMFTRGSNEQFPNITSRFKPYIVWNLGTGHAKEVIWCQGSIIMEEPKYWGRFSRREEWFELGSLGAKDWSGIPSYTRRRLNVLHPDGISILYSDFLGNWFGLYIKERERTHVLFQTEKEFKKCPLKHRSDPQKKGSHQDYY